MSTTTTIPAGGFVRGQLTVPEIMTIRYVADRRGIHNSERCRQICADGQLEPEEVEHYRAIEGQVAVEKYQASHGAVAPSSPISTAAAQATVLEARYQVERAQREGRRLAFSDALRDTCEAQGFDHKIFERTYG